MEENENTKNSLVENGKRYALLDGIKIELKPNMPRFALMGLAAAQAGHSQEKMVEASWRMVQALVADWGQFEYYMIEKDERFDMLDQFINDALDAYDLEVGPTVEPSGSSDSSTPIPTTSRVVSLERGTVETVTADGTEHDLTF